MGTLLYPQGNIKKNLIVIALLFWNTLVGEHCPSRFYVNNAVRKLFMFYSKNDSLFYWSPPQNKNMDSV